MLTFEIKIKRENGVEVLQYKGNALTPFDWNGEVGNAIVDTDGRSLVGFTYHPEVKQRL